MTTPIEPSEVENDEYIAALAQTAPAEVGVVPVSFGEAIDPNMPWNRRKGNVGVVGWLVTPPAETGKRSYFTELDASAHKFWVGGCIAEGYTITPLAAALSTQAEAREDSQPRYTTARMKQEKATSRRLAIVECMDALQSAAENLGFLSVEEVAIVLRALLKEGEAAK